MNNTKKDMTEHGVSMYRYRKCRCQVCKDAMNEQRRLYRKLKRRFYISADPLIAKLEQIEKLADIDSATMKSWRMKGISVYSADYWCLKYGYHPAEIFGQAFYTGCFDEEFAA
jgi:hypothetical protein